MGREIAFVVHTQHCACVILSGLVNINQQPSLTGWNSALNKSLQCTGPSDCQKKGNLARRDYVLEKWVK